jgi:hypothetical protein
MPAACGRAGRLRDPPRGRSHRRPLGKRSRYGRAAGLATRDRRVASQGLVTAHQSPAHRHHAYGCTSALIATSTAGSVK